MTTTVTLTAAVRSNGGALPLFNDEVPLNHGLKLEQLKIEPQIAAYRRMVRGLEFDVCELAPTTYLCARAYGRRFTAIPVSLSRGFHHRTIVCNAASGIKQPKDLVGEEVRRAGVYGHDRRLGARPPPVRVRRRSGQRQLVHRRRGARAGVADAAERGQAAGG